MNFIIGIFVSIGLSVGVYFAVQLYRDVADETGYSQYAAAFTSGPIIENGILTFSVTVSEGSRIAEIGSEITPFVVYDDVHLIAGIYPPGAHIRWILKSTDIVADHYEVTSNFASVTAKVERLPCLSSCSIGVWGNEGNNPRQLLTEARIKRKQIEE